MKSRLIGKDLDNGKDLRPGEERVTENKMARWHHQLSGHKSEQTAGNSEEQGSLVDCSPWGRKKSDMTEQLNNNNKKFQGLTRSRGFKWAWKEQSISEQEMQPPAAGKREKGR